jgi:UDPglucose--hexose-1-phosphate uridylyltransferase
MMELLTSPHRRYNVLTGEWILVSPQRLDRPWQGKLEQVAPDERPRYDPACYLCPGNERAGGKHNPQYDGTFVFNNDFAALLPEIAEAPVLENDLLVAAPERGICRVICFSPRHDLTLPELQTETISRVVNVWANQTAELGAHDYVRYVQIFENKGLLMGCSNPHPHGQVWATEHLPVEPQKEYAAQAQYFARNARTLLSAYVETEVEAAERLVCTNESWIAAVPFWAKWPFEVIIVPRRAVQYITELRPDERDGLADILKRVTTRYDNLFQTSFPYTMGFHQAPTDLDLHPHWHLHGHFYPPLLRSASVQKFMVGFEMLATPQRDITPEAAAERLRSLPEIHYKSKREEGNAT